MSSSWSLPNGGNTVCSFFLGIWNDPGSLQEPSRLSTKSSHPAVPTTNENVFNARYEFLMMILLKWCRYEHCDGGQMINVTWGNGWGFIALQIGPCLTGCPGRMGGLRKGDYMATKGGPWRHEWSQSHMNWSAKTTGWQKWNRASPCFAWKGFDQIISHYSKFALRSY